MKTTRFLSALLFLMIFSCGPKISQDILEVKVTDPALRSLHRTVVISGVLGPENTASVYCKLSGLASRITVDVGSQVKAGDILLEIDTHELGAQLTLAQASVAAVKQQAAQALLSIDGAAANYDLATKYLERINSLEDKSAISQSQMEDATAKVDQSKRALESAKLQYKTLSETSVAQAMAQVDVVKSQMENRVVRSPLSGVITNRNINPGELTSPQSPLFSIAVLDHMKLQGTVSQDVVTLVHPGTAVEVRVNGLPGAPLRGRITQVGPIATMSGQYFPVVVLIPHPEKALAGMTAQVILEVTASESYTVPPSAVESEQGLSWVWVVKNSHVEKQPVDLGLSDGQYVQILRGVGSELPVVYTNVSLLKPDLPVVIAEPMGLSQKF